MQHLALQIAAIHEIIIDQRDMANPGRSQI
jgi:hypothetical protein